MKFLKTLFLLAVILVIILVGGGLAVVQYVDWNSQKATLEKFIKDKSGYSISLDGDLKLEVFPNPFFSVEEISVASFNDGVAGGEDIFTAKNISLELSLSNLLSFNLGVKRFSIESPTIHLHRDAKGVANWQPRRVRHGGGSSKGLGVLASIGDVVISNGYMLMQDDKNGQRYELTDLQIAIGGHQLDTANIKYSANLNDVKLSGEIQTDLSDLDLIPLDAILKMGKSTTTLKGELSDLSDEPVYLGTIAIDGPDLLANYYKIENIPAEQASVIFPVELQSEVDLSEKELKLYDFNMGLGEAQHSVKFGGNIFIEQTKRNKQIINAKIIFSNVLNLNNLGLCEANKGSATTSIQSKNSSQGKEKWSTKLIDLSIMKNLNAEISVNIPGVICGEQQVDNITLLANAKKGIVKLDTLNIVKGEGNININGRVVTSRPINGDLKIKTVQLPVEKFMGEDTSFKAPVEIDAAFKFKGNTMAEWVQSLHGDVRLISQNILVEQGAMGNLVNLAEGIFKHASRVTNYQRGTVNAKYNIAKGVARTEIFELTAGNSSIIGSGKIDLYNWAINYRLEPQGELTGKLNVLMPVLIRGDLSSPLITPDMTSPQGLGAGIGATIGGPIGAGIGAIIGGKINEKLGGKKSSNNPNATNNDNPQPRSNPLNMFGKELENGFGKLLGR